MLKKNGLVAEVLQIELKTPPDFEQLRDLCSTLWQLMKLLEDCEEQYPSLFAVENFLDRFGYQQRTADSLGGVWSVAGAIIDQMHRIQQGTADAEAERRIAGWMERLIPNLAALKTKLREYF